MDKCERCFRSIKPQAMRIVWGGKQYDCLGCLNRHIQIVCGSKAKILWPDLWGQFILDRTTWGLARGKIMATATISKTNKARLCADCGTEILDTMPDSTRPGVLCARDIRGRLYHLDCLCPPPSLTAALRMAIGKLCCEHLKPNDFSIQA